MPPYEYQNYRSPYTTSVAELMLAGPNARARALEASGQAQAQAAQQSGQAWGNAAQQIGQTVAAIPQQIQQQQQMAQQGELLKSRLAEQQAQVAERQQQAQRQATVSEAITALRGGNAEAVLSTLDPQARLMAEEWLSKAADNKRQRESLQRKDLSERAGLIRSMGYDPIIAEVMFGVTADEYPEAAKIWQQIGGDPAKLKQAVDAYADLGKEPPVQKAPESFTLNRGDTRYAPDGTIIASSDPAPEKPTAPTQVDLALRAAQGDRQAQAALDRLKPPSSQPQEPLVPIIGPDGQPVLVPRSQAVGKRPASTREQGRPVTSGDAGRLAELDTSIDDLRELRQTLTSTAGATGTVAAIGAAVPAWATDLTGVGTTAKQRQGVIDRVKQVIGKALEGGVLRKEDEYKYTKILPTIKDTQAVAVSKLDGLEKALVLRKQTFIDNLSDANYDVGNFNSRQPAIETWERGPDGKPRKVAR